MKKGRVRKFTSIETAAFCSQIAMLLEGGVPLIVGTGLLLEETEDGDVKTVFTEIDNAVKEGKSFCEALEETGAFPDYMIQVVSVGEKTGKLEDVLKSLSAYYEREASVSSSVRSVVLYPLVFFSLMAVILIVLVVGILPMFETVFLELENRTGGTEAMMKSGLLGSRIMAIIAIVLLVFIIAFLLFYRLRNGAGSMETLINALPFTKKLAAGLGKSRFLAALSLMVSGGLDNVDALEKAVPVSGHADTEAEANICLALVKEGEPLDNALVSSGLLTNLEGRMLGVALKSGHVDDVLQKISEGRDEEVELKLNDVASLVETILVIILSVMVGAILISVMLPLISVIASI